MNGLVVVNHDDPNAMRAVAHIDRRIRTFGTTPDADVYPTEVRDENGYYRFTVNIDGKEYAKVALSVPGRHNMLNALACCAAAEFLGVPTEAAEKGLNKFTGSSRRFQLVGRMPNGATVVDDYAHHPSEMKATLSTAKEMHFDRILCAFQPHTYTRTKALFPEFVDALKQCDQAILAPIYAAREQNTIGIYSSDIAKEVPGAVSFDTFDEIADYLRKTQARTTSSSPWAPATSTRSARCSSSKSFGGSVCFHARRAAFFISKEAFSMPNDLQSDLSRLVARIEREDAPLAAADPYRPYFHLAPPVGWMNDPNGLCRCGEWYHVFYQYGPFDPEGGVKHWGITAAATFCAGKSARFCSFRPIHGTCTACFSGSALVEDGVMYLYYTGNVLSAGAHDYITSGRGHNTALAVCRDGLTAETNELLMENRDYPAGLSCHVRDPKVWAQDGRYYMVQGARTLDDRGEVLVFESTDKRRWTHINTIRTPAPFGYMWECPDLFELDGQWFLCCSPQGVPHEKKRFQNTYSCGFFPAFGRFPQHVHARRVHRA